MLNQIDGLHDFARGNYFHLYSLGQAKRHVKTINLLLVDNCLCWLICDIIGLPIYSELAPFSLVFDTTPHRLWCKGSRKILLSEIIQWLYSMKLSNAKGLQLFCRNYEIVAQANELLPYFLDMPYATLANEQLLYIQIFCQ